VPAKRLFVSLDLPASVAASLVRLNPRIPGVRWLAAGQFHLTLAFLGQVAAEAEEKLRTQLGRIRFTAFFLPLREIGTFPARGRPSVIWLGVGHGHPHLFQLHKRIADAALGAGIEPDLRPWHPHLTLARCQDVSMQATRGFLRAQADFDAGLVPFNAFHLKSSLLRPDGSIHSIELTVHA
jgi:2'-5' RNA ligase